MRDQARQYPERSVWLVDGHYYCTMGALALMAPFTLGTMLWLLPSAHAVDNWNVESANGSLYVHGALTESACRLEMESARQDVALGDVGTGSRDLRSGGLTWASAQPAVTVSFRATRDVDNPPLVKVQVVSGLGLRLENAQGEGVQLGERGKPLLLTPGQNTLSYVVMPERTPATLMAGSYMAVVDFHLSYD